MPNPRLLAALAVLVLILLVLSGLNPAERGTWLMETAPILIAAPILLFTYGRFPLTPMLYVIIALHAIILLVGGAYTYAKVPAGFWVQDMLGLSRNPYDKLGHFWQGFAPALIAREIFIRNRIVRPGRWTSFFAVTVALSVSLIYELIEWGAAVALGQGAESFLGTQGDVWDTQSDMGVAFLGAFIAIALFSRLQDRQINRIERTGW